MKRYLCVLVALCLLTGFALAEEIGEDVLSDAVEASVGEVEVSLGGDEPVEEPAQEEYADEEYIYESSNMSDYYLDCPDVYDYKHLVSASARVYPGKLVWPLQGMAPLTHVSSHVGWRDAARIHRHQGGSWASWLHHGIDVGHVTTSQVVVAAADGVAYAGEASGIGRYVVIDHGNGWYTRYQHLSRFAGEVFIDCRAVPVKAGDPIGYVGSTGGDYPVHLHFEIAWSPDGPGGDDKVYQKQTHNLHLHGYSFSQQCVVRMRWPKTWEMCSAEYQQYYADISELYPERAQPDGEAVSEETAAPTPEPEQEKDPED